MILKKRVPFLIITILLLLVWSCKEKIEFEKENNDYRKSIKSIIYSNPNKAITLSEAFLLKSRKNNNNQGLILSNTYKAVAFDVLNVLDSTIYYYNKALKCSNNPMHIIQYKYSIGKIYERQYKYKRTLALYKEILALAKKKEYIGVVEDLRIAIREIEYMVLGNKESLNVYLNKYNITKENKEDPNLKFHRKNLIQAYLKANKTDEVVSLINEGIAEANNKNNLEFQYYLYELESRFYIQKEELVLASNSINRALEKAEKLGNKEFENEIKYIKAVIKGKQGDVGKQIDMLKSIIEKAPKSKTEQLEKYYKSLAEAHRKIENKNLHLFYRDKYDVEHSKIEKKKVQIINKINTIFLDEEKLEAKREERKKWYWFSAFTILLCISAMIYIKNKKTQRLNKERFNELMLKVNAQERESRVVNTIENKEEVVEVNNENNNETSSNYIIDNDKVNEILLKLKTLEKQKYFLRQDCTLHNMAKRLKTNTSYLSKIVNKHLNKTFSNYINELRVNYAIIELKQNKQLRAYSTKAIAQELGYKKANSFSKYFKQATGITPAVYIKNIEKLS